MPLRFEEVGWEVDSSLSVLNASLMAWLIQITRPLFLLVLPLKAPACSRSGQTEASLQPKRCVLMSAVSRASTENP